MLIFIYFFFFFSSRRRHTRFDCDWSSDVCSSDLKKIGLWGGSYGGFLTAMGLARNSDIFAAGVDFHGVHDRSGEGRGGEEGRSRGAPDYLKKKKKKSDE